MKPLFSVVFVLAILDPLSVHARPIPAADPPSRLLRWLPTLGPLGLLGSLFAIVLLGNKADEAYSAVQTLEWNKPTDPVITAYMETLSTADNLRPWKYWKARKEFLGREKYLDEDLTGADLEFGVPGTTEKPDVTGMDDETRKNVLKTWGDMVKSRREAEEAVKAEVKARKDVDFAQKNAAVTIVTELIPAFEKAEAARNRVP
jgi:hypothetical protein